MVVAEVEEEEEREQDSPRRMTARKQAYMLPRR
ncbi:unnamed protein product [Cylicostephanus goldi]|uniref:Uncharacterized protein n=1 Tax=Cylicostephanus goldi TaxID=71465 RepID=A0A3P7N1B5_CYLGO|nr:unnamed protein product [Cylicostephanus goldi]